MTKEEIIIGLKDLINDRKSFISNDVIPNKVFEQDIKVLESAIDLIRAKSNELEQIISQRDYWKTEHSLISKKINDKNKEIRILKAELLELNMKFNKTDMR